MFNHKTISITKQLSQNNCFVIEGLSSGQCFQSQNVLSLSLTIVRCTVPGQKPIVM